MRNLRKFSHDMVKTGKSFVSGVKGKVVVVGGVIGAAAAEAAPIVVDTAETLTNLGIGFTAILLVAVTVYGYNNIGSLFGARK